MKLVPGKLYKVTTEYLSFGIGENEEASDWVTLQENDVVMFLEYQTVDRLTHGYEYFIFLSPCGRKVWRNFVTMADKEYLKEAVCIEEVDL